MYVLPKKGHDMWNREFNSFHHLLGATFTPHCRDPSSYVGLSFAYDTTIGGLIDEKPELILVVVRKWSDLKSFIENKNWADSGKNYRNLNIVPVLAPTLDVSFEKAADCDVNQFNFCVLPGTSKEVRPVLRLKLKKGKYSLDEVDQQAEETKECLSTIAELLKTIYEHKAQAEAQAEAQARAEAEAQAEAQARAEAEAKEELISEGSALSLAATEAASKAEQLVQIAKEAQEAADEARAHAEELAAKVEEHKKRANAFFETSLKD
jgi:hypothetical protein